MCVIYFKLLRANARLSILLSTLYNTYSLNIDSTLCYISAICYVDQKICLSVWGQFHACNMCVQNTETWAKLLAWSQSQSQQLSEGAYGGVVIYIVKPYTLYWLQNDDNISSSNRCQMSMSTSCSWLLVYCNCSKLIQLSKVQQRVYKSRWANKQK